ncbi:MAG: CRTAC1 family protein [Rubripirellula sp.]
MNTQTKKLLTGIALVAALLIGGAFAWISYLKNSAARQLRESVLADESVRGRILGMLPEFSDADAAGTQVSSDQLYGQIWIATKTANSDLQAAAAGDVPLVHLDALNLIDGGIGVPVSSSPDSILRRPADCYLVDHYRRVRGKYDLADELDVARIEHDIEIVESEKTPHPEDLLTSTWMVDRQKAQLATVDQFEVLHDFQFRDLRPESGITFRNKIVDDAGRTYEAAHYDHGNGVVVADVDGDQLLDLYFVTQVGDNELWRNLGGGKFEEITETAGVSVPDRVGVTASFADTDNDGDADLFVTTVRGGNLMFENDGKGNFTDITDAAGLDYNGHSSSAIFFDYDRDGLLDLFLTNVGRYTVDEIETVTMEQIRHEKPGVFQYYSAHSDAFGGHLKQDERGETSILYRNQGGNKFSDVSKEMNLVDDTWCGDATPVDFNNDGWMDLYLINMQGHDEYYVNIDGKKFERKSREMFPKTPWGAMGVKSFDFENDGDMDLFITDMHSDMSAKVGPEQEKEKSDIQWAESFTLSEGNSIWGNAFFRNDGDDKFTEISDQIGAENYWPWGLSSGDLNADGFEDVFITASMNFPFRYGGNSVLLNNRGKKFLDSEFILGVEPRRDGKFAEPWFELDAESSQGVPVAEGRTGRVAVWSALGSRSSVIFDLDGDGDLDIVTNENNSWPMVLISDLAEKHPQLQYLKVQLEGTESNRDALGAVVRITTDTQTLTKINDGQSGYMSQSRTPLYFGLGDAKEIRKVEVTWPSGKTQEVETPKPNETLSIRES